MESSSSQLINCRRDRSEPHIQLKVNPSSLILSGQMLFRFLGWNEAADRLTHAIEQTIQQKTVTYDLERQMDGAVLVKCSEFAKKIAENI